MTRWIIFSLVTGLVLLLSSSVARRHARGLIRQRRLRIDRFKLRSRHARIERDVLSSSDVLTQIRFDAQARQADESDSRRRARQYLDEIVPKFNLLAYYRFGAPFARMLLGFLYRIVVDRKRLRQLHESLPRGSVLVYVINHRSNADYLLVAVLLHRFISLSYAVGEWARVWPLHHLFKSFGAYFIRRNFRNPLYHAVLASYVSTVTRRGLTQGVFLEGGLSRDGRFRKPKLGMLDYLISSKRDPSFTAPLLFVPAAINYDRVLEDRVLTEELLGVDDRSSRLRKLSTTVEFLFKNSLRSLVRRFKRYGHAVVTFDDPIAADDVIRQRPELLAESFDERKAALTDLAESIMTRISDAMPMTPVAVVAWVLREAGRPLSEPEIVDRIESFRQRTPRRSWYLAEDTAASVWETAREVLRLRSLIEPAEPGWRWSPRERSLLDYYANSLVSFSEVRAKGWTVG